VLQALARRPGNPVTQVKRELRIVLQQAKRLELPERSADLLARLPGQQHQLVGVDALVGLG